MALRPRYCHGVFVTPGPPPPPQLRPCKTRTVTRVTADRPQNCVQPPLKAVFVSREHENRIKVASKGKRMQGPPYHWLFPS